MNKKLFIIFIVSFLAAALWRPSLGAETIAARMAGRILLEVERNGEAWYVEPDNLMKHYLGRPSDAFALMRARGVGITNADLAKIPVGFCDDAKKCGSLGTDTDNDGLPDTLEDALGTDKTKADSDGDGHSDSEEVRAGYNPLGAGTLPLDSSFAAGQKGRILLEVESHGEAWYIYPVDNRRYFLGRPQDAFSIMRALGLGITTRDLEKIMTMTPDYNLTQLERLVFDGVNNERTSRGLAALAGSDDLAAVAREHSRDLAAENEKLTGMEMSCDYPIIHHQGLVFGADNSERLNNRGVYYFSEAGENIALMPGIAQKLITVAGKAQAAGIQDKLDRCARDEKEMDEAFKAELDAASGTEEKLALVRSELSAREADFAQSEKVTIAEISWKNMEALAADIVSGWMASPGHRENILTADYDESGMGIAYVNGYVIATQTFIKRADCGFKGGACCEKEGYYPYCFIPLECGEGNRCQ